MLFTLTAFDRKTKTSDEIFVTRESPLFVPLKGDLIECFGGNIAEIEERSFRYEHGVGVHLTLVVKVVEPTTTTAGKWRKLGSQA